ncbi:MAG TPA: hypothetical protein VFT45_15005 [Longimicrobium sp.]|nr:hypothetical protein [Longimicrobium sp.]
MHRFSTLAPVLIALALAAACSRDRASGDAADAAAQDSMAEEVYVPPQLTPAESAAAVAKQAADGEAMTRRVMGPDYKPPTEPYVDTPEKQYASCLAQAGGLEEPTRTTILKTCERFKNPPPQAQP